MTDSLDGVLITRARAEDLPRIVAISNWAAAHTTANFATAPEPVEDWLATWRATHEAYPWLVARSDGEVIGFAKGSPHRARGAYRFTAEMSVYIDAGAHGRGVGKALYRALIDTLDAQGFVTLLAGITSGHVASERLHAAFGFTRCATFHRVGWKDGRWLDVGYWERHAAGSDGAPTVMRSVAEVWRAE